MESFNQLINLNKHSFTSTDELIINYIYANPATFINSTIDELSDLAFTSTSTISRLFQKLGFPGYKEAKYFFKCEYKQSDVTSKESDKVLQKYIDYLDVVDNLVSINKIDKCAKDLSKSKIVYICGFGENSFIVDYLAYKLFRFSINCVSITNYDQFIMSTSLANKNDLFIVFSKTISDVKIRQSLQTLNKNCINTYVYTCNSNLTKAFQNLEFILIVQDEFKISNPFNYFIYSELLINLLYESNVEVYEQIYQKTLI